MVSVAERLRTNSDVLLSVFDLVGTLVFALEGAMAAIRGDLDILGVLVLAFVTAVGGGILRDLLIGAVPPAAIRDWRYIGIAIVGATGAAVLFYWERTFPDQVLLTLDAAGLSLFAVAGAEKALNYQMHPLLAVVMGGITGVGGGTMRDLLLAKVPGVLHKDVYASAALLGGAVMVLALKAKAPRAVAMFGGFGACFLLRMVSVLRHWNLPRLLHLP
ncbi:MAG TPA: trimeric intracellular cation channel family protein [Acidobacteriaceae bacterium]|nr:trimeric intracellular cation channel family protein [Acidobacteriaceae bacterium]